MLKRHASTAIRLLAESNLLVALGAAMLAGSSSWFFGEEASPALLVFTGSAALFTYTFQRQFGDLDASSYTAPFGRSAMVAGLFGMTLTLWNLRWQQIGILVPAGALSLAYALPVFKKSDGKRYSLRKMPYLKIWAVLAAWLLAGVAAPLAGRGVDTAPFGSMAIALFTIQQGGMIFSLALAFDIRDLKVDSPGQHTLPQLYGISKSKKFANQALLVSALVSAILYLFGELSAPGMLFHVLICSVWSLLIRRCEPTTPDWYYPIVIDGALLAQGLGLLLLQ